VGIRKDLNSKRDLHCHSFKVITGPPNGPVLFCWLASFVVVCNAAGVRAGLPPGAWTVGAPRPGAWAVGRPTLHGGPVVLRPVRATPCSYWCHSIGHIARVVAATGNSHAVWDHTVLPATRPTSDSRLYQRRDRRTDGRTPGRYIMLTI